MTLTFGFYNSQDGDRVYDALDLSSLMEGLLTDGVILDVGNKFIPVAFSGMTIKVGSGKAWFNNTWTKNDTDMEVVIDDAHSTLNRIDTVVLEIDTTTSVRTNSIKTLVGDNASSPVAPDLETTSTKFQYPLCDIYIGAGVTEILTGNITVRVGTEDCPYLTATPGGTGELQDQIDDILSALDAVYYDQRGFEIILLSNLDALTTGNRKGEVDFTVPALINGWDLIDADAFVMTPSTSGTPTFNIYNVTDSVNMLSTGITVDINEYSSYSAASQPVIDTAHDDVATGDRLRFDCSVAGTGTKGYGIIMIFGKP